MKNPRALFAAGVVIVAAVLAVVFLPGADEGSRSAREEPRVVRAALTLEQAVRPDTRQREMLVSLPGPQFNSPDLTGGAAVVWLRCFDSRGALAIRRPVDWPLQEEAGFPPHIHQPANRRMLDSIRSCRLTGPGIQFVGRASGPLPAAQ